jgi:hypothetical protein
LYRITALRPTTTTSLTELLAPKECATADAVEYIVGGNDLTGDDRELAAQMLADDAMAIRCGHSVLLDIWRSLRDGTFDGTEGRRRTVAQYARVGFGTPTEPTNEDHLQGLVAELLWNRILEERITCSGDRRLVHVHAVKPDPLEPGGDGLAVYSLSDDTLVFRLWEIKKHVSAKSRLSSTVNRASKQLARRGHEYLAKLAGPATLEQDGPLGEFYADIIELWLDRSRRAGVGISIGTSIEQAVITQHSFRSLTLTFPEFTNSSQTEAIVIAMPEFPRFAQRVKDIVWSGL